MRGLVALLALASAGCAYQPEVDLALGPKRIEGVTEIGALLTITQRFGRQGRGICKYDHASEPHHGQPFNDEGDVTMDFAGCGVRLGGQRR